MCVCKVSPRLLSDLDTVGAGRRRHDARRPDERLAADDGARGVDAHAGHERRRTASGTTTWGCVRVFARLGCMWGVSGVKRSMAFDETGFHSSVFVNFERHKRCPNRQRSSWFPAGNDATPLPPEVLRASFVFRVRGHDESFIAVAAQVYSTC